MNIKTPQKYIDAEQGKAVAISRKELKGLLNWNCRTCEQKACPLPRNPLACGAWTIRKIPG